MSNPLFITSIEIRKSDFSGYCGLTTAGWYFWDESASIAHGPYDTYHIANQKLTEYAAQLNEGPPKPLPMTRTQVEKAYFKAEKWVWCFVLTLVFGSWMTTESALNDMGLGSILLSVGVVIFSLLGIKLSNTQAMSTWEKYNEDIL